MMNTHVTVTMTALCRGSFYDVVVVYWSAECIQILCDNRATAGEKGEGVTSYAALLTAGSLFVAFFWLPSCWLFIDRSCLVLVQCSAGIERACQCSIGKSTLSSVCNTASHCITVGMSTWY